MYNKQSVCIHSSVRTPHRCCHRQFNLSLLDEGRTGCTIPCHFLMHWSVTDKALLEKSALSGLRRLCPLHCRLLGFSSSLRLIFFFFRLSVEWAGVFFLRLGVILCTRVLGGSLVEKGRGVVVQPVGERGTRIDCSHGGAEHIRQVLCL